MGSNSARRASRRWMAAGAAVLAAVIFIFDTFSSMEIAIAALYVVVLVMSLRFSDQRGIALIAAGCAALTIAGYWISHYDDPAQAPLLRCIVSLLAIGIAGVLCVQIRIADTKMRRSEERYRNIFQTTSVAVWEQDYSEAARACAPFMADGIARLRERLTKDDALLKQCLLLVRTIDANDAARELIGNLDTRNAATSWKFAMLPESMVTFREVLLAYLEQRPFYTAETALRATNGQRRTAILTATFPTERSRSVLINAVDITDKITAEQALQQSMAELTRVSRIATLGALTASIGHEVNQPLAAVVTNAEAALRWLSRDKPDLDEVLACVEEVAREGRRAGDIIHGLRSLAVKGNVERGPLDINATVGRVMAMVERDLTDQQIISQLDLAPDLPTISGDEVQLQQVIMNLVNNAVQAMSVVTAKQLRLQTSVDPARGVRVSIADTGPGIADDHMKRLFAAFFTTKAEGMGIGLSICRSIIETHQGRIWAERNEAGGTTLHFVIPTTVETGAGHVA